MEVTITNTQWDPIFEAVSYIIDLEILLGNFFMLFSTLFYIAIFIILIIIGKLVVDVWKE